MEEELKITDYLNARFPNHKEEVEPASGASGEFFTEEFKTYLDYKFPPKAEKE